MDFLDTIFGHFIKPVQPLSAGVHHYQTPPEAALPYRLHLRLEADGSGILILNAHTILHLNQTAAEYGYHLVNQTPEAGIIRQLGKRYRIDRKQILTDYRDFKSRIETLATTKDVDPETFLGMERDAPYSAALSAPYRLDCALTYQTSGPDSGAAPDVKDEKELSFEQWKSILEKAWDFGIPHIIFTGGEPTKRSDLADLISCTQEIGQVSGLLTDGLRFTEAGYLKSLLEQGLDHIMLDLDVDQEKSWDAIKMALGEDIYITVHLTLDQNTAQGWHGLIDRLFTLGVYSISLSASSQQFKNELISARRMLTEKGINLVWDLPVPYSHMHPAAMENEEGEELAKGAGKAWLYVEPNADVLPCQGKNDQILGNLLTDPWEKVWNNALSQIPRQPCE